MVSLVTNIVSLDNLDFCFDLQPPLYPQPPPHVSQENPYDRKELLPILQENERRQHKLSIYGTSSCHQCPRRNPPVSPQHDVSFENLRDASGLTFVPVASSSFIPQERAEGSRKERLLALRTSSAVFLLHFLPTLDSIRSLENTNLHVAIPVFSIRGNLDDPPRW